MRFNTAIVCALAATTPLATAAPMPAWNDKGPEAGYKFGAIACSVGALICNTQGQVIGTWTLGAAGVCCSSAAAAVTASQSDKITGALKTTGDTISSGAAACKDAVCKGASACKDAACKAAEKLKGKKTGSVLPTRSNDELDNLIDDLEKKTDETVEINESEWE